MFQTTSPGSPTRTSSNARSRRRGRRQRDPRAPRRRRLEREGDLHLRPGRARRLPAGPAGRHQRRLRTGRSHPLRHDVQQSVPPGWSGQPFQTNLGPRLQRGQGVRPDRQHSAHGRPDPCRPLLDREAPVRHQHHRAHSRDRQRQGTLGHCSCLRAGQCRHHGRVNRDLGRQSTLSFWRPYTAIRGPDGGSVDDSRADTPLDSTWLPLNGTPGRPGDPCAHCELSAAGSVGLTAVYGSHTGFTITTSTANPAGSTHTYQSSITRSRKPPPRAPRRVPFPVLARGRKGRGLRHRPLHTRKQFRPDDDH